MDGLISIQSFVRMRLESMPPHNGHTVLGAIRGLPGVHMTHEVNDTIVVECNVGAIPVVSEVYALWNSRRRRAEGKT